MFCGKLSKNAIVIAKNLQESDFLLFCHFLIVFISVADPDPDPVFFVTRIRINTGSRSGSFVYKKTPCYSNFLVIKLSKIQFRPNNFSLILSGIIFFLSLILSVIGCFDLVRKCHKKYLFY